MNSVSNDIKALLKAFVWYFKQKIIYFAARFEDFKNFSVGVLMIKRGAMQKQVWHGSMIILVLVGLLTSGIFSGQTVVSSTYPGIGGSDPRFVDSFEPFPEGPLLDNLQDPNTKISQKPRAEIIEYKVEKGDSISTIAQKFGVSTDTIKWANNLTNINQVKPGDILKILPVSGVSHTVKSGNTLESIAKKYQTESQGILDFPFNDIPDDFSLKIGQILIVPDGVIENAPAPRRPQPKYITQGPASTAFSAPGGGNFVWPAASQGISQYFAWYHPGVDLPNRNAPPVSASDGGVVVIAGWPDNFGYGNRVVIDHGNGYRSLYAHLSNVYVSVGETISRGQIIGQMGSTGRSTGTHLHFEIHYKGVPINPLNILR